MGKDNYWVPPPPKPPLGRVIIDTHILMFGFCPRCSSTLLRKHFFTFKAKCSNPECGYDTEFTEDSGPFTVGQTVRHVKTRKLYLILKTPDANHKLEYCKKPFYVYQSIDTGNIWYRAYTEMEDGRFMLDSGVNDM